MRLLYKIKNTIFPDVDREIQKQLDRDSLINLSRVSLALLIVETLSLFIFIVSVSKNSIEHHEKVSVVLVLFCIISCLTGYILSKRMVRKTELSHWLVVIFKIIIFVAFSAWAIASDFRHYRVGEQILTYHAVNLIVVCFFMFVPWLSVLLIGSSYVAWYFFLYFYDSAAGIQIFNFFILCLLSIVGAIEIYHYHKNLAAESITLARRTKMYEELSHHDALTGLWNRYALAEDEKGFIGKLMIAFMIDINDFKSINDKYGHTAGDKILKEAADKLHQLFPACMIYRYGGDEFLVLCDSPDKEPYLRDYYSFYWANGKRKVKVTLCFGKAEGLPDDHEKFNQVISAADNLMYQNKKRIRDQKKKTDNL